MVRQRVGKCLIGFVHGPGKAVGFRRLRIIFEIGFHKYPVEAEFSHEMCYIIQALTPASEAQRTAKAQALGLLLDVGQTRWLMFEQQANSASLPLLMVLTSWLTVLFISLGIFAPRTTMAITTLFVCAISVSGASFSSSSCTCLWAG